MADDFERNLATLAAQLPGWAAQAMAYAMLRAEQIAKATTAFNDVTGNLRNSIQAGVVEATGQTVEGAASAGYPDVGASMIYAPYIELGTSRMAARPFIWPSIQQVAAEQVFERALQSYLQQGLGG